MLEAVETQSGPVRGVERSGTLAFLGLPFAAPATGTRRFLPPEPPEPWTEPLDASRTGPAAPQMSVPALNWLNAAGARLGEDCLRLNVWTPACDGRRRPVLVWVHGGGFLIGSGATPVYRGETLARRGDVVIVTINYRLGVLGYGHLGMTGAPGLEKTTNLGMRDQIAALEWVRDNIERFGGDPGNVTLFGQSAGGMSVGALLGAPRARPLFHRAICQSGAADNVIEAPVAQRVAEVFLEELGEPANLDWLGELPMRRILGAQMSTMARLADMRDLMVFLPVVDDDVIPEQPLDAIRRGEAAHIPLLTGVTLEEWKLFGIMDGSVGGFDENELHSRFEEVLHDFPGAPSAPVAAQRFRSALGDRRAADHPRDVWGAFQTSRIFHWPSTRLAEAQVEGGGRAWSYLFTFRPGQMLRHRLGACHAIDIPFVFGSASHPLARPLTGFGATVRRLSENVQSAWLSFARSGDPNHPRLPHWPDYETVDRSTMVLSRRCRLSEAPLEAERQLLESWASPFASGRPVLSRSAS